MTATRYLISDADTGLRLAASRDAITAEEKARALETQGHRVAVSTVELPSRSEPRPAAPPRRPRRRPRRSRSEVPMRFYDLDGVLLCRDCRDDLLTNAWRVTVGYSPNTGAQTVHVSDEPPLRSRDFEALGDRPWAGNDAGQRYVQCDNCNSQWGPDA